MRTNRLILPLLVLLVGFPSPAFSQEAPLFATEPEWSSQGVLVFAGGEWPDLDLFILPAPGAPPIRILRNEASDYMPSWSPDGASIVFASTRSGAHDLYILDVTSGEVSPVAASDGCERSEPRWSPDGAWIAYRGECDGNRDLFLIRPDGTGRTRLTDAEGEDGEPAWAPDSRRLVFSSERSGSTEVWVVSTDGSGLRRVTVTPSGYSRRPEWSPDGATISFGSNRDGDDEIYTVPLDGGPVTNVSRNPAREYYSRWSPDGTRLVFTSNRDQNGVIYDVALDGSDLRELCCRPRSP